MAAMGEDKVDSPGVRMEEMVVSVAMGEVRVAVMGENRVDSLVEAAAAVDLKEMG